MASRAIRESAPYIGYAISHQPISPEASGTLDNTDDFEEHNERYDSRIMHHVVPATLELWRVEVDASDERLAASLGIDLSEIRAHWFTSRTAMVDPRPTLPVVVPKKQTAMGNVGGYRRFSRRRHSCAEAAGMGVNKGFQTVPLATLQAYRDLASDLRIRLENINEDEVAAYDNDKAMIDRESTSLESVSCGLEPMPIQKEPSKVDLDVLYGTPL